MEQIFNSDPTEPQVTEEFLQFLQRKFPLEGFKNVRTEQHLYRYQGAQDVIDFLQGVRARQQNEG
jgi:hypothetical protein